jgi:hypothetical protein
VGQPNRRSQVLVCIGFVKVLGASGLVYPSYFGSFVTVSFLGFFLVPVFLIVQFSRF